MSCITYRVEATLVSVCVHVLLLIAGQPHSQLLCTTGLTQGLVRLSTGAGSVSVQYSSTELLQPPIVRSIAPLVWDPAAPTTVVIEGERCGRARHAP